MRLATWLLAVHGRPGRLAAPLVVVRAALAGIASLGLTEAQIRGAVAALEAVGFLDRDGEAAWQRGKPRRKPTRFAFAGWVRSALAGRCRAMARRDERRRKSPEAALAGPQIRFRIFKAAAAIARPPGAADPFVEAALARLGLAIQAHGGTL
jgi:hypothetical protein